MNIIERSVKVCPNISINNSVRSYVRNYVNNFTKISVWDSAWDSVWNINRAGNSACHVIISKLKTI